MHGWRQ